MSKKTLQAQGYYEGATKVWIHKAKLRNTVTQGQQIAKQDPKQTPKPTTSSKYQWRPKQMPTRAKKTNTPTTTGKQCLQCASKVSKVYQRIER